MTNITIFLALAIAIFVVFRILFWLASKLVPQSEAGEATRAFGPFTGLLASLLPSVLFDVSRLDRDLRRAGNYSPHARINYLSTRNFVLLIWASFIVLMIWLTAKPNTATFGIVLTIGIIGAIIIFGLPRIYLGLAGDQRVAEIEAGLPDALDVVTMAVTGGLPFQGALDSVRHEIRSAHPELGREFDIIHRHAETSNLEQAFDQFAERVDAPEIRSLAAIVSQSERMGANVAVALRDYADGIRRASRLRAEERANRTSVKLLFPVVLCLAPPTYILLLGPAFLELRNFVRQQSGAGGALTQADPSRLANLSQTEPSRAQLQSMQQEIQARRRSLREFLGTNQPGSNVSPTNAPRTAP